jgi:uncharacterized membrane-anchored protein YhcB (DUF1043 family)
MIAAAVGMIVGVVMFALGYCLACVGSYREQADLSSALDSARAQRDHARTELENLKAERSSDRVRH